MKVIDGRPTAIAPSHEEFERVAAQPLLCYACGLECDLTLAREHLSKAYAMHQEVRTYQDRMATAQGAIEGPLVQLTLGGQGSGLEAEIPSPAPGPRPPTPIFRYRATFEKGEEVKYLSHLDLTRALPRAGLFSNWQVSTNDDATLGRLADRTFDPNQLVLVAEQVTAPSTAGARNGSGSVEYTSYAPKDIKLQTKADAPSILLLNDKYDPEWHVYVDGKEGKLLRCNYIMRGVAVPAGRHNVEFRYQPALHGLYTTLDGLALAIVLCVVVPFIPERGEQKPEATRTA